MLTEPAPFPLPELAQSLVSQPGVGPATAKALGARGIRTVGDALFFFPRRYEDRRQVTPITELEPGKTAVVAGRLVSSGLWGRRGKVFRMVLDDGEDKLVCLWFRFKRQALESFKKGMDVIAVGAAAPAKDGSLQFAHPEIYGAEKSAREHKSLWRIIPVYPEVEGVWPGSLRRIMAGVIEKNASRVPDPLFGLLPNDWYPLPAGQALINAHLPSNEAGAEELEAETSLWRKSLAANELLYFELGLALKRKERETSPGRALEASGGLLKRFLGSLPFKLTPGQKDAVSQIRADMSRPSPMGRLLCGDVGTGKTVVAAAAAALAAEAGVQTAIMAPTEVLARQHMATLGRYLEPLGLSLALATGSLNGAQKKEVQGLASGQAQVIVGTHALISGGLKFRDLGLVIIDEQHRFGVHQRLGLAAKGAEPHLLVLSATPIPRTLALALAGHLDISDLPQRPGGAPKVQTSLVQHAARAQAVQAVKVALARGEQVYVICPLVEESGSIEAQDAIETHRRLAEYFPQTTVGLLHGRMTSDEQQASLEGFKSGKTRVLVATTVVEVGVDVPGATLMVILTAERFGLSQLHQLRGRVGRGEQPGHCFLVAGSQAGEHAIKRLKVLCSTLDGIKVAEADLHIRGPGEALGARQSGLPPFKVADWSQDAELAPPMREIIQGWLRDDPDLAGEVLAPIKTECLRRWGRRLGLADAG